MRICEKIGISEEKIVAYGQVNLYNVNDLFDRDVSHEDGDEIRAFA